MSRSGTYLPDGERTRKPLRVTLSPEARARLEELAEARGTTLSGAIEQLVRNARAPNGK